MKTLRVTLITSFLLSVLVLTPGVICGEDEKTFAVKDTVSVSEDSGLPFVPKSFCVDDDGDIYIPNHMKGSVIVLGMDGKVKDYPQEKMLEPSICSVSSNNGGKKLNVIDFKAKKMYSFQSFVNGTETVNVYPVKYAGYDARFSNNGDSIFIAGYEKDSNGVGYELYSIPATGPVQTPRFILPAHEKYGISAMEYANIEKKYEFSAIGIKAVMDVKDSTILYAWEGNLRLMLINTENGRIIRQFGRPTAKRYKKPDGSILAPLYKNTRYDELLQKRATYSYVVSVFFSSDYVYAVYTAPSNLPQKPSYFLQKYSLEGKWISESKLTGNPSGLMYFNRSTNTLYSLSKTNENKTEKNTIKKYLIE